MNYQEDQNLGIQIDTDLQKTDVKRPWKRPHIQQLRVSVDTAVTVGSGGDGGGRTSV